MSAPFIRTQYNLDARANSDATGLDCKDKTLAQQQFKDDADINVMFGKYLELGEMPQIEGMAYGDFTGIFDFQSAMNVVRTAQSSFDQLPAKIKNRFDNNPQKLVEFLNDPANKEEAQFLKLVNPDPAPEPAEVSTVAAGKPDRTKRDPASSTHKSDKRHGKPDAAEPQTD